MGSDEPLNRTHRDCWMVGMVRLDFGDDSGKEWNMESI